MSNISGVVARIFVDDLDRVATILVRHLPPVIAAIQAAGGRILEGQLRPRTAIVSSPATPTERSSNTSRPETSAK
jgi:hypothetical protein